MIEFGPFPEYQSSFEEFSKHYDLQFTYSPPGQSNSSHRGAKKDMICRFCGLRSPETTFKSKPHIIPRALGMNSGVSNIECDRCNNHFSRFETDLTAYISLPRLFEFIGKGSVPKFGFPHGILKAEPKTTNGDEGVELHDDSLTLFNYNEETGLTTFNYKKDSYIPLNIYKSLLKIALTILPWEDFINYKIALDFILKGENVEHFPSMAKMTEANIELPINKPACLVFKKKDPASKYLMHIFCLYSGFKIYQVFLPFNYEDRFLYDGSPVDYLFCPSLILSQVFKSAKTTVYDVDLSSNVKKNDGVGQLSFIFGKGPDYKPTPGFNPKKMKSLHFARIDK